MKNLLRILFLILCLFVQTQNLLYAQQPIQRLEKNTSAGVGELFGDSGVKSISTNYPISEIIHITTPPPGKIIIKGEAGSGNNNDSGFGEKSSQELPVGQDYTIIDSNGNVWAVDENGNITQNGKIAQGGASTPENTNGVDKNGVANAVTAKGISVSFEEIEGKTLFAFDKVSYQKALTKDYKTIDGKFIPFKAVVKGKEEPLLAKVHISDSSVSADSLIFKTEKGVAIESKKIGNAYQLNLKGLYSYATEQVQAVIKQGDKYNIAGVFQLVHLEPKGIKVHLVPTKGVTIDQQTIQQVQDIYSKVGVGLEIEPQPTLDITPYLENGKLSSEDSSGDLTRYSPAQIRIINDYKAQNNTELAYYIFVTDRPSSNGQRGYMKLNGQFGFVFLSSNKTTKNDARVIAHELAHGAFKLEHPFKDHKQLKEGDANSLMDYNTNSTELIFTDWKQINDPKLKIYAFQSQREEEFNGGYVVSPDYKIFTIGSENTIIDRTDYNINPSYANDGTLPGFIFNGEKYWWKDNKYVKSDTDNIGYPISSINELSSIKDKWLFLFYDKNKECGNATYIAVKVEDFIKSKKEIKDFIASYLNAPYGNSANELEKGKKELVACVGENSLWEKEAQSTASGVGKNTAQNFFDKAKQGNGNNQTGTNGSIIDFSGGFTAEQIQQMVQSLQLTTSKTGVKGRIIITDNNTTDTNKKKAQNIFNTPNNEEIIIWLDVKNLETKEYSIKINAGNGLPQFKNSSVQKILNEITAKKGWFEVDEFWTIKFNPLTAIFDGLAYVIKQLEVPAKFYDVKDDEYNPILFRIYDSVSSTSTSSFVDTVIQKAGIPLDAETTSKHLVFAYACGLWNGAVDMVASIPEIGSLISNGLQLIFDGEMQEDLKNSYQQWITYCQTQNNSNTYVGCAWDMIWDGIKTAHTEGSSTQIAHRYGKSTIEVVTIPLTIVKVGKIGKINKLADAINPLNQVIKAAGKSVDFVKAKTFLKNTYQITDNQADEVVEKVWGKIKKADNIFNLTEFKNLKGVTPGVDNKSLTNLPKSFWDKAYKYKPNSNSLMKKQIDNIITNGDPSGKLTEQLVESIMKEQDYKVGNGRYYGEYEKARNGIDGFFYKGDINNPTEIIVIDSKQMNANGSVSLNQGNFDTGLPIQMQENWIRYIAKEKLINLDGLQKQTATAIENSPKGFIQKYITAVDKTTGEINFLKLGQDF